MTFTGYLGLGGNEIVNNARVSVYATTLGIAAINCSDCGMLPRALEDGHYSSPDMDDAPWWDPTVSESKDFAGVLGLEFVGLSGAVNSRDVIPLAADGGALAPVRRKPREILVRAMLFARTEAALSYGRTWLSAATRGGMCGLPCVGDELCYLAACPTCGPYPPPGQEDTCGDVEWRQLFNVGILQGPTPEPARRSTGGWMQEVSFTLTAGNPYIYRLPKKIADGPGPEHIIPGFSTELPFQCDPAHPEDCVVCTEDTNCIADASQDVNVACTRPPLPMLPLVPPDPCYPTTKFNAFRAVVSIPADFTPRWLETVPLIRVRVGARHLQRFILRWYSNAQEIDCFEGLEDPDWKLRPLGPCEACAELSIPIVPKFSTLTLDGRIERAWVDCPGGPGLETAEPTIFGRAGTSFQWPVFGCGQSMCLEIIALAETINGVITRPDATWEISTVPREDAS